MFINPLLSSIPNWGVAYMNVKPDGKPSKAPVISTRFTYQLNELTADNRFYTLDEAQQWLEHVRKSGNKAELSFGMCRADNILCVDIDYKHMGHSQEDVDFVLETIKRECKTFWELSASKQGLHLYYLIEPGLTLNYLQFAIGEYNAKGEVIKGEIGLYMEKRHIIQMCADHGGEIVPLCGYGLQAVSVANSRPKLDITKMIEGATCTQAQFDKALESARKSKHWWPGADTNAGQGEGSHSAGDLALFKHVAIQVNFDWQSTLEVFKQSPRYNPERIVKKNVNRDWFADEAKRACAARYQEQVNTDLMVSSVQINMAKPPQKPVASPLPKKAVKEYKDTETGVTLSLGKLVGDSAAEPLPPAKVPELIKQPEIHLDSPLNVPLPTNPKIAKVSELEEWPKLKTGEDNPSNVDYRTPEGFIQFVTAHDNDLLMVKIAKLLMAQTESIATSVDTYILNALLLLTTLIGPKAKNYVDGENNSLFTSPRVINVGGTGTGKTLLAKAVNEVLASVPADARPGFANGLPVSGQAAHDTISTLGTGNGLFWYLPEVAELLAADSTDSQRNKPHLFEANKILFISAADATAYGTALPSMFSVGKNRPAVQGIYVSTLGDCTAEIFATIFGTSAVRGTTNRGIFNLMSGKIPSWTSQLDEETPIRRRALAAQLAHRQMLSDEVVEQLTCLGRGELITGKRFARLDPLRIYLASPSSQPPVVERLFKEVKAAETSNINARAMQHIRSLLQTAAVCDLTHDKELDRYCVNPDLARLVIGLVTRAGLVLSDVGGLLSESNSTGDAVQDAIVTNIYKIILKGPPAVHAHRKAELLKSFIGKSLALHNMDRHPTVVNLGTAKRSVLNNALIDLAENGHYITEVPPNEKVMNGLAPNGVWYKLNLQAFNTIV